MPEKSEFIESLYQFVEIFGRRSIEDFVKFTKESGLSMPQINVLLHLYHIDSCVIANVKKYISGDSVAASQIVDRLVERGLVERFPHPTDRRIRMVRLTQQGQEMVQASIDARRQWILEIARLFDSEEQQQIVQSVNLLVEKIKVES